MLRQTRTGREVEARAGTMRRKGPAARLVVLYAAAFVLVSIVLIADAPPKTNHFLGELYQLRHVLFFGIAGLIVLELTALLGRRWIRKRSLYYLVAGFAVAGASLGLEILSPEAGAFSVDRLLRNFCGGIAFLTLRRRSRKMLAETYGRPASAWRRIRWTLAGPSFRMSVTDLVK